MRLNRLTLASPAPWRQNGNLTAEINAVKTAEWRTCAQIATVVGDAGDALLPITRK